ncbi:MAG TPA: hypothetical protein VGH53_23540 [Streptosporangiaceae bacterium]
MSAGAEDRMSTLERRCRLLLRLYPVAYRSERGEEILGTLLEATPEVRAWPLPRDVRGLAIGGLRARAAINGRNTTAANLRVAVLVGVAAHLAYVVGAVLGDGLFAAEHGMPFSWPMLVVATLIAVTLVVAWLSRRRAIVLAGALPAAAALAVVGPWRTFAFGSAVTELACLAVLIALAGPQQPDRRWLWLIGPILLAGLLMVQPLPGSSLEATAAVALCLLLTVATVSLAWLAIDARPAIAVVVFLLAAWLPFAMADLVNGSGLLAGLSLLGICAAVAAPALWLLHRQSAHAGRPTHT